MTGVLAALGAAIAWTAASGMWRSLSTVGPAWLLNVLKNSLATLCFLPVLLSIPWGQSGSGLIWLLLSGAIGIALGDTFYLLALRRLGTRRTLTIESIGPVLASIGSVVLMGEVLAPAAWIGACCVTSAVVLVAKRGSSVGAADPRIDLQLFRCVVWPDWCLSGPTCVDQQLSYTNPNSGSAFARRLVMPCALLQPGPQKCPVDKPSSGRCCCRCSVTWNQSRHCASTVRLQVLTRGPGGQFDEHSSSLCSAHFTD